MPELGHSPGNGAPVGARFRAMCRVSPWNRAVRHWDVSLRPRAPSQTGARSMSQPDLSALAASFRDLGLAVLAEPHRLTVTAADETLIDVTIRGGFLTLEWKC